MSVNAFVPNANSISESSFVAEDFHEQHCSMQGLGSAQARLYLYTVLLGMLFPSDSFLLSIHEQRRPTTLFAADVDSIPRSTSAAEDF